MEAESFVKNFCTQCECERSSNTYIRTAKKMDDPSITEIHKFSGCSLCGTPWSKKSTVVKEVPTWTS